MINMLREAHRSSVAAVAKAHGVSEQTLYNRCQRFVEMNSDGVHRLKQFAQENARLKKILAARDLEIEVMREITAKSGESMRPSPASRFRGKPGAVAETGVPAAIGCEIMIALRTTVAGARRAGVGRDDCVVGPISSL